MGNCPNLGTVCATQQVGQVTWPCFSSPVIQRLQNVWPQGRVCGRCTLSSKLIMHTGQSKISSSCNRKAAWGKRGGRKTVDANHCHSVAKRDKRKKKNLHHKFTKTSSLAFNMTIFPWAHESRVPWSGRTRHLPGVALCLGEKMNTRRGRGERCRRGESRRLIESYQGCHTAIFNGILSFKGWFLE